MPEGIFSPMHLLIVLVIVILLFGAKKLPELGTGLGMGIREFKNGVAAPRRTFPADLATS